MDMSPSYAWIYMLSGLLTLLFYIGALIFVIFKRGRHPQAGGLAIIGVSILLLTHIGSWSSNWMLSRFVDTDQFLLFNGIIQLVLNMGRLFALAIILAAVFAARGARESADSREATVYPPASDNPYASPSSHSR